MALPVCSSANWRCSRHLSCHSFHYCTSCYQYFYGSNAKAEKERHVENGAHPRICYLLFCALRETYGPHPHADTCPDMKKATSSDKWYSLFALLLPDQVPPDWGTCYMLIENPSCSNAYEDRGRLCRRYRSFSSS